MPTNALKSLAGRPLRCQVSSNSSLCCGVKDGRVVCSRFTFRRVLRPDGGTSGYRSASDYVRWFLRVLGINCPVPLIFGRFRVHRFVAIAC